MFRGTVVVVVVVVLVRTDEEERGRLGGTVIRNVTLRYERCYRARNK